MKYATQHGIFEKERRRTARSPLFSGLSGGALGEIRTPDPRIRSPMLSDADLALAYRGLSARARIGPKADFHQCRFWRSADVRVRSTHSATATQTVRNAAVPTPPTAA